MITAPGMKRIFDPTARRPKGLAGFRRRGGAPSLPLENHHDH